MTLTNANTLSGATTVSAGTLVIANAGALQSSTVTVGSGSTVGLNVSAGSVGGLSGAGNVYLNSGLLTAGGNNSSTTFGGVISTAGGFSKAGAGMMTLMGSQNYNGPTTVASGVLKLGSVTSGGGGSTISVVNAPQAVSFGTTSPATINGITVGSQANVLVVDVSTDGVQMWRRMALP